MNSARGLARRIVVAAAAMCCALALAGCASVSAPVVMTVNSGAFVRDTMPARFTCAVGSKVVNPPVGWAGAPADTKSLALVVDDSDAPITPYVYWIVFNISPATPDILAGRIPMGAAVAYNSRGTVGYAPPCPARFHQYRFTIYALNAPLPLRGGASLPDVLSAIAGRAIGRGRLPAAVNP